MGIEDLKARIDRLLDEHSRLTGSRERLHDLHGALVDLKVGLKDLTSALGATERELVSEREQLETSERRGRLAADIGDHETAQIAGTFVAKHRERIQVLERKLAVQKDEIAMAERDYADLSARFKAARGGRPDTPVPSLDFDEHETLRAETTRQKTEEVVNAQLEALKRKLGRRTEDTE